MNPIESYQNTKKTLEIIDLRLKVIEEMNLTFETEKRELSLLRHKIDEHLKEIESKLKSLQGIEHQLYYEIIVNGLTATKAVDKVAYYADRDVSTLWKNYYPAVKKEIAKLSR